MEELILTSPYNHYYYQRCAEVCNFQLKYVSCSVSSIFECIYFDDKVFSNLDLLHYEWN